MFKYVKSILLAGLLLSIHLSIYAGEESYRPAVPPSNEQNPPQPLEEDEEVWVEKTIETPSTSRGTKRKRNHKQKLSRSYQNDKEKERKDKKKQKRKDKKKQKRKDEKEEKRKLSEPINLINIISYIKKNRNAFTKKISGDAFTHIKGGHMRKTHKSSDSYFDTNDEKKIKSFIYETMLEPTAYTTWKDQKNDYFFAIKKFFSYDIGIDNSRQKVKNVIVLFKLNTPFTNTIKDLTKLELKTAYPAGTGFLPSQLKSVKWNMN